MQQDDKSPWGLIPPSEIQARTIRSHKQVEINTLANAVLETVYKE